MPSHKITPFLWYDGKAGEAARFYCSVFKNGKILDENPMSVTFEVEGQTFYALNGGPQFKFTEAISLFVSCETQAEVDELWSKLQEGGGSPSMCGWLKDKYGLSWQVIPKALGQMISHPDREKANRAIQAMLKMQKIDIATMQRAFDGT